MFDSVMLRLIAHYMTLPLFYYKAAIGMVLLYHLLLRPMKLLPRDDLMNSKYEDVDLTPRISYFRVSTLFLYNQRLV